MAVLDLGSGWVTPDWLPLALVVVLLVVIGLLYLSMRRNIARIDVPRAGDEGAQDSDDSKP